MQKTLIRPPASRLGPLTPPERAALQAQSPVAGVYDTAEDRDSAYEILQGRAKKAQQDADNAREQAEENKREAVEAKVREREEAQRERESRPRASGRQTMTEAFAVTLVRTVASTAGRELIRGLLGGLVGGTTTRRRRR